MRRLLVLWGGFGALIGVALGGAFDWTALVALGAIGAVIGTIGAVVVCVGVPKNSPPTNYLAIAGCLVGAVVGGPLGAMSGLGRPMLALFNPDLPPRDFQPVFGAVGGVFVGAVAGALVGAAVARMVRRKAERSDAAASP